MNAIESMFRKDFRSPPLITESFLLHGLTLNLTSNSTIIMNPILNLLHYFRSPVATPDPSIHFYLLHHPISEFFYFQSIHEEGHLLFDSEKEDELHLSRELGVKLRYLSWKEFYVADFESAGVLILDLFGGKGVGMFPDPASIHPRIIANYIFLAGLCEILRSKDLFLIHAAALAKNGKGVLIPGFTRSGKTTLSIALLRGRFQFLSDDRPFLKKNGEYFELLAFPEALDVTDQTLSFFPELQRSLNHIFKSERQKKELLVDRVYPNAILNACRPKILLFPNIVDKEISQIKPLSKIEAIQKLLPHSLLVFEEKAAEKQFQFLCQFVEEMDCYCLDFGRDLLEVDRVIEKVL
jgi:hypothetical protein